MKHYKLVKLMTRSGDFEDYSYHLIERETVITDAEAYAIAFEQERRCEYEWEDETRDSAYDCGGEIYVRVDAVSTITKAEYDTLEKYL